jgi:excisionase family DNA binding protein
MSTLLTVNEVAKQMAVAPKTVRKWIKGGVLAGIKMPGGDWRFKQEHIEGWLARRTVKAKHAL